MSLPCPTRTEGPAQAIGPIGPADCLRNRTPALSLEQRRNGCPCGQTSLAGPSAFEGRPHLAGGRRHYRRRPEGGHCRFTAATLLKGGKRSARLIPWSN